MCYSGRTLQQGTELLLGLGYSANISNYRSHPAGRIVICVPYLKVVIQDPGILDCSVFFVTKHCHVQNGLAAHAVNRNTPNRQCSRSLLPPQQSSALWDRGRHTSAVLQSQESSEFLLLLLILKKDPVKKSQGEKTPNQQNKGGPRLVFYTNRCPASYRCNRLIKRLSRSASAMFSDSFS